MGRIVLSAGHVIDPANGVDEPGDVVVESGRIVHVGPPLPPRADDERIDASGCYVTPGLIDPHVHLREPGFEDAESIATGTAAGVDGGFTTLCCMPNTNPALDSRVMIEFVNRQAELRGRCRVFAVGAVTVGRKGEELAEIRLMSRAGAVGFSDDGDVVESPAMMRRALTQIRLTGLALMQHCQEPTLTRGAVMNAGPTATRLGLIGWPSVAEELIIERDIRINRSIGCRYHVQHLSCAGAVEIVRRARAEGQPVSAEASPHHLLLTDEACEGYDTMAKMNPPLRSAADVQAVREGVADGTITVLATDHAPHTAERKALPFDRAPFGIVGLETALALYIKALIDTQTIRWSRLIELMTVNAARLCNLDQPRSDIGHGLGSLTVGSPADVTVIDPELRWTIRAAEFPGKSRNTPFEGWDVRGRAVMTIVGGRIMLDRQGRSALPAANVPQAQSQAV
ncbi:MAG: dihydroorotase [Phycisphaerales bacterium]|nr:dihydroorotase [Phycisphaerales bacterium]